MEVKIYSLKILILGSGALGCQFGILLQRAGHKVTFIARGHQFTKLKNGLMINIPNSNKLSKYNIKVLDKPELKEIYDLVILSVKSKDTNKILNDYKHLRNNTTKFLSFQNIMNKEEILAKYFGSKNVIGAVSNTGAFLKEYGIVIDSGTDNTFIGSYGKGMKKSIEYITNEFNKAGIKTQVVKDIESVKWHKIISISSLGAISALTQIPTPQIYENKYCLELIANVLSEGISIMNKHGYKLKNYNGLELKQIYNRNISNMMQNIRKIRSYKYDENNLGSIMKPSMLQDILNNKKTECEDILGFLIKKADLKNIQIPSIKLVYLLIRGYEEKFDKQY